MQCSAPGLGRRRDGMGLDTTMARSAKQGGKAAGRARRDDL